MNIGEKLKNLLSFVFRIALSGLLLWYLFGKIDMKTTGDVLKSANLLYIGCAAFIFVFLNLIILLRWFVFIQALSLTVRVFTVVRYFFIGLFGNLFLPSAIGGDVIKILGLCSESSQKPRVVASVLLDRLSGFAGIVILAIVSAIFGYQYIKGTSVVYMIVFMGTVSLAIACVLFNERIYSFCSSAFNFFPKFKKSLMQMHYDVMLLSERQAEGFAAIGISCVNQIVLAFMWFLIAKALHQDISFIYFLIFVPILCVVSSFPSIGGLGVREAGAAFLFAKVGVDPGVAVSLSLINFLFMIVIGLFGGVIYVFTLSSGRVQHNEPDIDAV